MSTALSGSTSSGLVDRVRARDDEAWKRLVRLYAPLAYRWARQSGLQASDAADVVQEVFLTIATNIDNFRSEPGSFRGWLRTITRNQVNLHYRKRRATPCGAGGSDAAYMMEQHADEASSSGGLSADDSRQSLVHRALQLIRQDFQPATWQAFWRVVAEDRPVTEVAEQLGMSAAAVRQAKYRVLCRLHDELGPR
jgi:RNA polymerase sigma-70 factor (ECF subfamily)